MESRLAFAHIESGKIHDKSKSPAYLVLTEECLGTLIMNDASHVIRVIPVSQVYNVKLKYPGIIPGISNPP